MAGKKNSSEMKKLTLLYFNPDCFTQVDDTVLHHLVDNFNVVWFYLYDSRCKNMMRYTPERAQNYADKHGIKLEIIDSQKRKRDPRNLFFFWKLAKLIKSYAPDIIYSCLIDPYWYFVLFCFIRKPVKVVGVHDVNKHSYGGNISIMLMHLFKDYFVKKFDAALTFSPNQRDLFYKKYGKESIMVGMSYKDFGKSSLLPGRIENGIKLLFFGTINEYKGLDSLISSLEDLFVSDGIRNIKLTIAGKGPYWSKCESLLKTPSLYNLRISFLDNCEIPDLMCSHHFLVLPYKDATQSGPLVTALNYNLPIIAPEYGCFVEIYKNNTALFYQPGYLRTALKRLSFITQDEYNEMRNGITAFKSDYSEECIAQNYIRAFLEVYNSAKTKNS